MRAVGTEPFWGVSIDTEAVVYSGVDQAERRGANDGVVVQGTTATWSVRPAQGQPFTVTLMATECSDGMSDRTYPLTAIVKVGEEVEIVGIRPTQKTTVTGVEMFRKLLDQGQAGDNVGVLLRGTKREDVERGQVLCKPGSVKPHTKFEAEAYILTKEEGGRHTPFFANYRPQFYFRTTDVTGTVKLPEGTEMVMPGDNLKFEVELIAPIAMEEKLRFAIREGGRTVGAGVVAKIIA